MKTSIAFLCAVLLCMTVHAQNQQVLRGRIISALDSAAIEGVSVQGSGTRTTLTDRSGLFEIPIPARGEELKISHIGYEEQKISPIDFTEGDLMIIALSPLSREIAEVMVSTGYEEVPIERTTGSFSVIDRATLDREVGYEVISRLDQLATGVYFDRTGRNYNLTGALENQTNLSIHGISTLRLSNTGANMPLIILDNFPFEGNINEINPNDIENITILKDAAAASIWGAKAGNGVIVITTRKGKYSQTIRTSFSASMGLTEKPALFEQKLISTSDVIDLEQFLFSQGYYNAQENNRAKPALSPVVEILIRQRDGEITSDEAARLIDGFRHLDVRNDLLKYNYRQAEHQQYAWTMSGGSDNYRFSSGVGYDRSLPTRVNRKEGRLTLRLDQSATVLSNLEINAGIHWTQSNPKQAPASIDFSEGRKFNYAMLTDESGNPIPVPHDYRMRFLDTAGQGALLDWHYRPLEELQNYTLRTINQNLLINTGLTYQFVPGLNMEVKYRYSINNSQRRDLYHADSYYIRNRINRGTELKDGQIIYHFPVGGMLQKFNSRGMGHSGRAQVNFHRDFSSEHNLRALLGMDIQQNVNQNLGGYTTYGFNDEVLTQTALIDHSLRYPVFANLAAYDQIFYPISSEEYSVNRYVSHYANASYSYKSKYILSGSARRDASNLFGLSTNDRWTPLWSVGFAWNIDKEPFMSNLPLIDRLKLRASYGYSGNVDQTMSALTTIRYETNNMITGVTQWPRAAVVNSPPNPELRWEKVGNWNIGLDMGIGNRLSITMDLYRKFTSDLFQTVQMDPSTGHGSMVINAANTRSTGVDVNLQVQFSLGTVNWSSNFLFTYNENRVVHSHVSYTGPRTLVSLSGVINPIEGGLAFPAYSYQWAGLDPETGEPMGYLNGEISKDYRAITSNQTTLDDLVFHGSARPLFYGTWRNQFRFKDLSLSLNFGYRLKYYFRHLGTNYAHLVNNQFGYVDYYDRWQQPGDELHTHVPAFRYPLDANANTFYLASEVLMERGDHIRLQDVRLDYDFSSIIQSRSKISFFVSAHNLGILWRANDLKLDPEMIGRIPSPRTYKAGLQMNF